MEYPDNIDELIEVQEEAQNLLLEKLEKEEKEFQEKQTQEWSDLCALHPEAYKAIQEAEITVHKVES